MEECYRYDANEFFMFLEVTGMVLAIQLSLGGLLHIVMNNPPNSQKHVRILTAFNKGLMIVIILTLVGGCLCYKHEGELHDLFEGGITFATDGFAGRYYISFSTT